MQSTQINTINVTWLRICPIDCNYISFGQQIGFNALYPSDDAMPCHILYFFVINALFSLGWYFLMCACAIGPMRVCCIRYA